MPTSRTGRLTTQAWNGSEDLYTRPCEPLVAALHLTSQGHPPVAQPRYLPCQRHKTAWLIARRTHLPPYDCRNPSLCDSQCPGALRQIVPLVSLAR
jgi:hypothetical protein